MKAIATIASLGAGIALFATGITGGPVDMAIAHTPIDRSIARGTFNAVYPIAQAEQSLQKRAITVRLGRIVTLMSEREPLGMSDELRATRAANLQRLLAYRNRGEFPVNYDHPGRQLPCFIDRTGPICAVGYLVEKTAGRDLAEQINREYQYATVGEMRSAALDRWIATSGFTRGEIATIQEPAMEYEQEVVTTISESGDTTRAFETRMRRVGGRTYLRKTAPAAIDAVVNQPAVVEPLGSPVIGQARGAR